MLGVVNAYDNIAREFSQDQQYENAYFWYRKAYRKLNELKIMDDGNEALYSKKLKVLKQRRDYAEGQIK